MRQGTWQWLRADPKHSMYGIEKASYIHLRCLKRDQSQSDVTNVCKILTPGLQVHPSQTLSSSGRIRVYGPIYHIYTLGLF